MDQNDFINEKVGEILLELEESKRKELEKVISEKCGPDHFFLEHGREEAMKKLKKQLELRKELIEKLKDEVENTEAELKAKEAEIERLNNVNKLDKLPEIDSFNIDEIEFATDKEREKVANKFEFLAQKIKESNFISQGTLKTFDFYRSQLISRCLKEEEYWEKSNNL
ncbi:MAG: hypothetical protein ACQERJ_07550 [Bacillota bacterium]